MMNMVLADEIVFHYASLELGSKVNDVSRDFQVSTTCLLKQHKLFND